jgi:hypothetical protein
MLRHHSTKNLKLMGFNPTILYILITHTYDIFLMWDSNISTFTHVSPSLHCYTSPQTEALFLFLFLFSLFFFFFFYQSYGFSPRLLVGLSAPLTFVPTPRTLVCVYVTPPVHHRLPFELF